MKKRMFLIVLAALCLLFAAGCAAQKEPKADADAAGVKVTVKIVAESQEIDETHEITTTDATLEALLKNNAETLGATMEESTYGAYITGMGGYLADATCEYFAINVNGEASMVGVSDIVPAEGDVYEFVLTGF